MIQEQVLSGKALWPLLAGQVEVGIGTQAPLFRHVIRAEAATDPCQGWGVATGRKGRTEAFKGAPALGDGFTKLTEELRQERGCESGKEGGMVLNPAQQPPWRRGCQEEGCLR